jgi:hypothetical protein
VLTIAVIPPDDAIHQEGLPYQAIWNSFCARLLLSLVGVALPFLIIAGLVPNLLPHLSRAKSWPS